MSEKQKASDRLAVPLGWRSAVAKFFGLSYWSYQSYKTWLDEKPERQQAKESQFDYATNTCQQGPFSWLLASIYWQWHGLWRYARTRGNEEMNQQENHDLEDKQHTEKKRTKRNWWQRIRPLSSKLKQQPQEKDNTEAQTSAKKSTSKLTWLFGSTKKVTEDKTNNSSSSIDINKQIDNDNLDTAIAVAPIFATSVEDKESPWHLDWQIVLYYPISANDIGNFNYTFMNENENEEEHYALFNVMLRLSPPQEHLKYFVHETAKMKAKEQNNPMPNFTGTHAVMKAYVNRYVDKIIGIDDLWVLVGSLGVDKCHLSTNRNEQRMFLLPQGFFCLLMQALWKANNQSNLGLYEWDLATIKSFGKKIITQLHPDRNGSKERFLKAQTFEFYEVKRAYDQLVGRMKELNAEKEEKVLLWVSPRPYWVEETALNPEEREELGAYMQKVNYYHASDLIIAWMSSIIRLENMSPEDCVAFELDKAKLTEWENAAKSYGEAYVELLESTKECIKARKEADKSQLKLAACIKDREILQAQIKATRELTAKQDKETARMAEEQKKVEQKIAQRDIEIVEKDNKIAEKDNKIAQRDIEIVEKDKKIAEKDNKIAQRDIEIAERNRKLADDKRKLADEKKELANIKARIKAFKAMVAAAKSAENKQNQSASEDSAPRTEKTGTLMDNNEVNPHLFMAGTKSKSDMGVTIQHAQDLNDFDEDPPEDLLSIKLISQPKSSGEPNSP